MEDGGLFSRSLFLKLFFVVFSVFYILHVVFFCVTSQVSNMDINQEKLEAILRPILDEVFDSKLNPIIQSLEFMSRQYDALTESNKTLTEENKVLKSQVGHLRNEISQIRVMVEEQEQYLRRDCLVLSGIPKTSEENTDEIVNEVATLMNVGLGDSDISVSHRLPTKSASSCPNIIVKFTRRECRDNIYRQRKKLKDFSTSDINLGRVADNKIFISESLTASNKQLFDNCLKYKKVHRYKYIWTWHGKIFLRKDERSPPWQIRTIKDLN